MSLLLPRLRSVVVEAPQALSPAARRDLMILGAVAAAAYLYAVQVDFFDYFIHLLAT